MYKLCKTEQSASRQRQLEEGLMSVMLTKRYEDLSVSELCDTLGIPRKSFYRYFSSKDGALHALIDHTLLSFELFTVSGSSNKKRTLTGELENFFQFWLVHKDFLDALSRNGLSGMLIERAVGYSVSEAVLPRRFLPGESAEMQRQITRFCVCGVMSMVVTWHHGGYRQSAAEMARVAVRILEQPLFSNVDSLL